MVDSQPPVTPWWQKSLPIARCYEHQSSEVQCKYYSLASTVCRVQKDQEGINQRRCERLMRKLRDCGRYDSRLFVVSHILRSRVEALMCCAFALFRGFEEIEVEREELTEPNFRGSDADLRDPERFFRYHSHCLLYILLEDALKSSLQEILTHALCVTRVPSSSQRGGALDANIGEAIEEFMHYAEDLKQQVAKGGSTSVLVLC